MRARGESRSRGTFPDTPARNITFRKMSSRRVGAMSDDHARELVGSSLGSGKAPAGVSNTPRKKAPHRAHQDDGARAARPGGASIRPPQGIVVF